MHNLDPIALLVQMATSAAVVVLASLLVQRAGALVGALVATLPLSAGPAYVFLAIDHGDAFVGRAALASLPVIGAIGVFIAVYVRLAQRHGLVVSLGGALLACIAIAWVLNALALPMLPSLLWNLVAFGVGTWVVRPYLAELARPRGKGGLADIAIRTASVVTVVMAVVVSGRLAGPALAGIVAFAPVVFTSLILVLQPRIGGPVTATVLANGMLGMMGYVPALCLLHLAAVPLGAAVALPLTLGVLVGWNLLMLQYGRRLRP